PQQMICPAARLASRIHVGAAEEIGLHVHLQHLQLAGHDALVDPLMARVEAARVAAHGDQAALLLYLRQLFGVLQAIRDGNLDLHVLARTHALDTLLRMHLRRRGENRRLHARLRQALAQILREMRDLEALRHFARAVDVATGEGYHLHVRNFLQGFQLLDAEGALAGYDEFDAHDLKLLFSRIRWPSAVLDAGT